jgi:hypothetical protein
MVVENKNLTEELEDLYDFTPSPDDSEFPPLNEGLTEEEIAEAPIYNQLKRGVMVTTGEPGSGKETFMHFLLFKLRTLFKGFNVMLDKKPRILFGKYIPFNETILMDEFRMLDERYKTGKSDIRHDFARYSKHKEKINELVNQWRGINEELFYNCGMGLGEFWRYFYNRDPHNPMNKAISPLFKRFRHYDLLVLGSAPHLAELDIKSCLQYVTHEVRCSQTSRKGIHIATIHPHRYYAGRSIFEVADVPTTFIIDALEPRDRLGGKCVYDLFNSYERGESVPRVKIKT